MHMKLVPLLLGLSLLACSPADDTTTPEPQPQPHDFAFYEERLVAMADNWWACNRFATGELSNPGDCGTFTGVWLGVATCPVATQIASSVAQSITDHGGLFPRHASRPEYTLDAQIALFWGSVQFARRCGPEASPALTAALQLNAAEIDLEPGFDVQRQAALHELGPADEPSPNARGAFGTEMILWARGVVSERAAAFRLHLGFLGLDSMHVPNGKLVWCEAVKPAEMPLMEEWCGRSGELERWVAGFELNRLPYQHQRAVWETEGNLCDGLPCEFPALDVMIAMRVLHGDREHGYKFQGE